MDMANELNRTKISLASRDEILAELEEENIELRKSRKQEDCSGATQKLLEETISSLRESLREKTNELCESQKHSDDLTKALTEALDTVKEMQRPVTPISESTRVSEPSVSEELGRLQDERDEAVFECQRVTYRLRAVEVERDENAERADAAIDEARELGRHLKFVDERKRLENDLKTLFARCEKLRRENNQMASELDEARLVALRREGREVSGRCKCQEMTTEIIALRSKLATVDSRLASTHSQLINAVEGKPGQDAQLRALYKSLKIELESIRGERDRLRVERDKLKDDNITLTVKASCAESGERRAKEDVEVLKQQLEIIKERKEIEKIEVMTIDKNSRYFHPKYNI
uniref:HOOK domain-containing protein n=1 Tax=Heterorhabditis bacteriophora TaxID=37862 RepID=A0A1I7WYW5_HETBA